MENDFFNENPDQSTRRSFDNESGESSGRPERPKRTISDPNRGEFIRGGDFSGNGDRNNNRDERGGYNRERNFNRDDRGGDRGGFNRDRSFNRDERSGDRGGFNRERSFNRGERGSDRGGFNRERSFNRDERGGDRGSFNRERGFNRDDRSGDRSNFNRDDRSGDRGGFNRERNFNRDERGGDRGGFNRDRSFNRDDRGGDRGGFNRDRSFNRDDRGGDRDGFNRDRSFNRDDRGGDRGNFYSPFDKRKSFGSRDDRNDGSRTLRPRKNRGDEMRPKVGAGLTPKPQYVEEPFDPEQEIRLNKYVANSGVCSRREADNHILAGEITVNGEIITTLGTKIKMGDEVRFNGEVIKGEKKVYLLLNKPKGYVTSVDDPHAEKTVMELIKGACSERVYPVGRLDKSTTGVLLLTNDGELTKMLTHPTYSKKKIYHVFLDKRITEDDMERIATGIDLDDGVSYADAISYVDGSDKSQVGVEIHSGKNRIIRRMFDAIGYKVIKLDRVYFAGLTKKSVPRGKWRFLTQREVGMLKMGSYE